MNTSMPDRQRVQRHTISTLVASQSVGAFGISIGVATAAPLAKDLSGSEALAGLAQTSQVLGAAIASWLLARMMASTGRRIGLVTGYLVSVIGGATIVLSGVIGSMPLLLLGALLFGAISSANLAARYAAADLATEKTRGRSLSLVIWATTIGAVAGPNLSGPAARFAGHLDIPSLTGPFLVATVTALFAAGIVWVLMRPDPLFVARQLAMSEASVPATPPATPRESEPEGHPIGVTDGTATTVLHVLRDHPILGAAIAAMAAAHAVMVSVMVMTPIHMQHGGASISVVGFVISIHVLGMYAFSPLAGLATDRWGAPVMIGIGGFVLLVSLVISATSPPGSSAEIFGGLFLLGLGWCFATIAAATLVTERTPLVMRTQVQGTADLWMSVAAAGGSALSGLIVARYGFPVLAGYSGIFALGVVAAAWYARRLVRAGRA